MRKGLRNTLIVLAVLLVLLVVVPLLIPTDSIRRAVEKKASSELGMPVTIADLSLRFLPSVSLAVHGLKLSDVPGGTPKLAVASGNIAVEVGPLLHGHVDLTGVHFKNVTLRVSEQGKGKDVHTVHIDRVNGALRLTQEKLEMARWQANLYGGTVKMTALLKPLSGNNRTLRAKIDAKDVHIQPLLKDAKGVNKVSGLFTSTLTVSAKGADDAAMRKSLEVDGPIQLIDGQLTGVGLEGSAVALLHGKLAGEAVVFKSLGTKLRVRGENVFMKDIMLQSSYFDATGHLEIAADKKLKGEIQTSGTANLTGMKLLVAGTTEKPRVYPAPSSMIGAVIGGAVGGPLGAAAGAKVGGTAGSVIEGVGSGLKKLFDGKKK